MKNRILLTAFILIVFGLSFGLKSLLLSSSEPGQVSGTTTNEVHQVISLAPSITETLYLLELENKLAGNTIYCTYPPAAQKIEKVGGYSTPDFEKVVMLKPDLVIMMNEHRKAGLHTKFADLNLNTMFVSTRTVADILESIRSIGQTCGAEQQALDTCRQLEQGLAIIQEGRPARAPRVLITVGKNMGTAGLKTVFAAGKNTYYNELLELAGGVNACPEGVQEYIDLAGEALLRAAPDLIIDIVPDADAAKVKQVKKIWKQIPGFTAAVAVLTEEYCARPGPSFLKVLQDIQWEIEVWNRSTP